MRLTNTFECIFIVSDRKPLSWRRHDVDIIFLTGHETQNTLGKKTQYIKAYYVQNHVNIATSQNIYIIVIQTICSEHDINLLWIVQLNLHKNTHHCNLFNRYS